METVAPSPARHGPPCELVHNHDLRAPHDVVDIPFLQLLGLDCIHDVRGPLLPGIVQIHHLPSSHQLEGRAKSHWDVQSKLPGMKPLFSSRMRGVFILCRGELQSRIDDAALSEIRDTRVRSHLSNTKTKTEPPGSSSNNLPVDEFCSDIQFKNHRQPCEDVVDRHSAYQRLALHLGQVRGRSACASG